MRRAAVFAVFVLGLHLVFMATPMHARMAVGPRHDTPAHAVADTADPAAANTLVRAARAAIGHGHGHDCPITPAPAGAVLLPLTAVAAIGCWRVRLGSPCRGCTVAEARPVWPPGSVRPHAALGVFLN